MSQAPTAPGRPKTTRQRQVEAAAANPTAPARAAHIDKPRVVRVNKLRRKTHVDDGEEGDDEEEEGEEEQGKVVGTKRKLAGRKQAQTLRKRISVQDRLKEFPKQTLEVEEKFPFFF